MIASETPRKAQRHQNRGPEGSSAGLEASRARLRAAWVLLGGVYGWFRGLLGRQAVSLAITRASHSRLQGRQVAISGNCDFRVSGLKSVFYRKIDFCYRKNDQEKISEIFVHVAPENTRLNQLSEKSCSKNSF